ncbi:MAG: glycosyltransferase [Erysipelotrichia bacterium]|nr:glycosyltransferase [Erysipelotrichia bacterium]
MSKKLNVCLLNDSFPPIIDGVANAVVNYSKIIQKYYGNVIVATPEYPNVKDNYDFQVLRYPSVDTTKMVGYRAGLPFDLNYLNKFNNENTDILHSHCPVASTFLARILRDKIHKPIVFTYHTKFDIDIARAVNSKLIQEAAIKLLIENIEACDDIWVVSQGAGENLKSLGFKGEYTVMHNGVDFTKGKSSSEDIEAIKKKYDLPNDLPIYLFVGRMMWYKGLKIIIDALRQKKNANQDFRMLFVGDGGDIKEVQQYVIDQDLTDKCIFAGAVSDRKILKDIFSSCDVFLFPSTFDTNGIVVREAAAAGLGTILIKGSCAAEDTIDNQNVIQIEENADSLAKVLIQNNSNVNFYHQIGEHAQQQLYLSWEDAVKKAVERYQEILKNYHYEEKGRKSMDLQDNFFAMWAQLANGLEKAQENRLLFEIKYNEQLKKVESNPFNQKLNNFIEEQRQKSLDSLNKFNANKEELRKLISDYFDHYL